MSELQSPTPEIIEEYTPEQQLKRLERANSLLSDWKRKINDEYETTIVSSSNSWPRETPPSLMTLVDKILAISYDLTGEDANDVSTFKIGSLGLSAALLRALSRGGINRVSDLLSYSYNELLEKPGLGKARLTELKNKLGELGVSLPDKK